MEPEELARAILRVVNAQDIRITMGSLTGAWVLVIEDLKDQAELWSDICAEAGLNAMTEPTGVVGYWRGCDANQRSSCST